MSKRVIVDEDRENQICSGWIRYSLFLVSRTFLISVPSGPVVLSVLDAGRLIAGKAIWPCGTGLCVVMAGMVVAEGSAEGWGTGTGTGTVTSSVPTPSSPSLPLLWPPPLLILLLLLLLLLLLTSVDVDVGVGVEQAVSMLPDRRCVLLPSTPTTVGVIRFLLVVEPTCPCPCPCPCTCTALDAELGADAVVALAGDSAVTWSEIGSVRSIASAPLLSTVMLSLIGRMTVESIISGVLVTGSVTVVAGST